MSLLVSTLHFPPLIPPAKSVSWLIFIQRWWIPPISLAIQLCSFLPSLTIRPRSLLPLSSPMTSPLKNSSQRLRVGQFLSNIGGSPISLSIQPCPFLPLSSPTSLPLKNSLRSLEVDRFLSDVGGSSSLPHLSATLFPAALISNNLSLNMAHLEGCRPTHPTNGLPLPCGLHL
jgi:hypothetical protein